jgi:hypothetical protein
MIQGELVILVAEKRSGTDSPSSRSLAYLRVPVAEFTHSVNRI